MSETTSDRRLSLAEVTKSVQGRPPTEVKTWHEEQVREGIKEANEGEFATDEQVKAVISKYVPDA